MRARAALLVRLAASLVGLVGLAGCEAPPAAEKTRTEKVVVSRDLLHAFRDAIHAHYELRLLAEPGHTFKDTPEKELALATDAEKQARARLVKALADSGSREAQKSEKLSDLIPILRDALVKGGRWAFIGPDTENTSFALVRLAKPPEEHHLTVFGAKWDYDVYLHDETVIEDYATYRARKLAPAGTLIARPAVTLGRAVYLDLEAAARIGRNVFFPRIAAYQALEKAAREGDEPFTAQASDLPKLLVVAKDLLRWRSLASFWDTIQAQPADDQARRFAEDYALREEVRAACEAFELEKVRRAGDQPVGEKLLALERRTYLAAIVHGEPLGQVATLVGLAADLAANEKTKLDPGLEARLRAAASVTLALIRQLAGDPKGRADSPAEDARDVARLARATPDQLRDAARALAGP